MPEDDLTTIPVEEVKVKTVLTSNQSVIGSDEFGKEFAKLLCEGAVWRTAPNLATKLGVDAVDLVNWMDKIPAICRKAGKEDGVYFYALVERIQAIAKREEVENKKLTRTVVTEEDRYAASGLHLVYGQFLKIMEKYALRIHDKCPEAFNALMTARDRLSAGTILFHNATKVETDKLPKL